MRVKWAAVWRGAKIALAVAIVGGVGWQFAKILRRPELWQQPLEVDPAWVAVAAALYALGFTCWGGYWWRLLRRTGEWLPPTLAARAYFVSQLGKYVPGKAVSVFMRVAYARAAGVRTGVAAITATYETLTTIAAGALIAAILVPFMEAESSTMGWKALGLLAITGIPILPGVFNRVAARLARPFVPKDAPPLPQLGFASLLGGLAQTSFGWLCLSASLQALLRGLGRDELPWLDCLAYVSLSYVAGFLTLPAPGGLGVREAILQQLLARQFAPRLGDVSAETFAVVVVLLLRLIWTVTELGLAAVSQLAVGSGQWVGKKTRP
jgi:uncharacterized membrane protein YbhN (UPF0104 family)